MVAAGAAVAALAGVAAGPELGANGKPIVPAWRLEDGRWVRRRFFEMRVGDRIRHGSQFVVEGTVTEAPSCHEDGEWGVTIGDCIDHPTPPAQGA